MAINNVFQDEASIYLIDLPEIKQEFASNSNQTKTVNFNFIKNQTELNILLIGTEKASLHLSIFGIFTCAILSEINSYVDDNFDLNCKVIKAQLSENLDRLYITTLDEGENMKVLIMNTNVLNTHAKELFMMAMKYVHLETILNHVDLTMQSITEAWESILLEMDSKLSKYASNVPDGTVCADFLDLLMFGIPSDEMEEFLMQDLTDKGLKKLGHSIELSYSNIQKLLLTHINTIGQNITFHLAELRGMARMTQRYKVTFKFLFLIQLILF